MSRGRRVVVHSGSFPKGMFLRRLSLNNSSEVEVVDLDDVVSKINKAERRRRFKKARDRKKRNK